MQQIRDQTPTHNLPERASKSAKHQRPCWQPLKRKTNRCLIFSTKTLLPGEQKAPPLRPTNNKTTTRPSIACQSVPLWVSCGCYIMHHALAGSASNPAPGGHANTLFCWKSPTIGVISSVAYNFAAKRSQKGFRKPDFKQPTSTPVVIPRPFSRANPGLRIDIQSNRSPSRPT